MMRKPYIFESLNAQGLNSLLPWAMGHGGGKKDIFKNLCIINLGGESDFGGLSFEYSNLFSM